MDNHYILVVDDDPDIRSAMSLALDTLGYHVRVAANGDEAFQVIYQKGKPCVIYLDLMMPFMNGPQFYEKIAENPATADIPIVVISADRNVKDKASTIGIQEFLKKPIGFDQINKTTSRFCLAN